MVRATALILAALLAGCASTTDVGSAPATEAAIPSETALRRSLRHSDIWQDEILADRPEELVRALDAVGSPYRRGPCDFVYRRHLWKNATEVFCSNGTHHYLYDGVVIETGFNWNYSGPPSSSHDDIGTMSSALRWQDEIETEPRQDVASAVERAVAGAAANGRAWQCRDFVYQRHRQWRDVIRITCATTTDGETLEIYMRDGKLAGSSLSVHCPCEELSASTTAIGFADLDFSRSQTPGLPPIAVSADEDRFSRCDVITHNEAQDAPSVWRVICVQEDKDHPDVGFLRLIKNADIYVLDAGGAELAPRTSFQMRN